MRIEVEFIFFLSGETAKEGYSVIATALEIQNLLELKLKRD